MQFQNLVEKGNSIVNVGTSGALMQLSFIYLQQTLWENVYVVLKTLGNLLYIYNITAFLALPQHSFTYSDPLIGAKIAARICIGGNNLYKSFSKPHTLL